MFNVKNKVIYYAVIIEALVVALTMFGFLPRVSTLYLTAAMVIFLAILKPFPALKFFILSIPWLVALPLTATYDRLPSWRLLIVELCLIWLAHNLPAIWRATKQGMWPLLKYLKLGPIDLAYGIFLGINLILLFQARFALPGLKQTFWWFNLYLIYFVAKQVINTAEQRIDVLKTLAYTALTIVAVGFVQQIVFLRLDYVFFWQYWSNTVVSVLYGQGFANLTTLFNSWFSFYVDKPANLRMFSTLNSSQVFAVVSVLSLPAIIAVREFSQRHKKWWTVFLVLTLLGAVLSAVRGIYLAALGPITVLLILYWRKIVDKVIFKKLGVVFLSFIILIAASPLILRAFNLISTSDQAGGSLLSRAESTFNLKETSAAARLAIWRQSLESFKQDPIAGIGNGNFSLIFVPRDQSGTFEQLTQQLNDALKIPHIRISAHNTYIHILVESGLLGFLAFLGFILVALRQAYKSYKAENNLAWRLYAAASAMALIWLFTYNVFDAVFLLDYQPQLFFWLSLALLTMPQNQTSEA